MYRELVAAEGDWLTAREIAERSGVAGRTVRSHVLKLTRLGVVEQAVTYPGLRYRLRSTLDPIAQDYCDRLHKAAVAFNVPIARS